MTSGLVPIGRRGPLTLVTAPLEATAWGFSRGRVKLPDLGVGPPGVEPPVDSESARGIEDDRNSDEGDHDTVGEHPDRTAQQTVVHEVEDYDARADPGGDAKADGHAAQELAQSQEGGEHGEIGCHHRSQERFVEPERPELPSIEGGVDGIGQVGDRVRAGEPRPATQT